MTVSADMVVVLARGGDIVIEREHPDDKLVERYYTPSGMHVAWERHGSGDLYGGEVSKERGHEIMRSEGLDPETFQVRLGDR